VCAVIEAEPHVIAKNAKPRLAVVSPFLDKQHGTERIVAEWVSYLADKFEVHIYSQEVRDIDPGSFVWHRIPKLPGPHLINFAWWFLANQLSRAIDRQVRGMHYDLVFSPGINCLDADAMSVHIVFGEYARKNANSVRLLGRPLREWPRLIHRKLYYGFIMFLERRLYTRNDVTLVLIARKTFDELSRIYGRHDGCHIVYTGLDLKRFSPERCATLRALARHEIGLEENAFAIVLVGNDWRNKGVPTILEALALLESPDIHLLIVSREDAAPARAMAHGLGLQQAVHFLPPREDVEFYYAAADAYAGPSLEDTFAIPPAEAMACGLSVIVSRANGCAEIIRDGEDGLILEDSRDAAGLARMIQRIRNDADFRSILGQNAAVTAGNYTWDRNGQELTAILEDAVRRKKRLPAQPVAQDI
jgi:glycosyltransferase involved in cell wall biosynthesis